MRYSGIGGQAVMEGVMMKNKDTYAVAVRKSDGEIIIEKKEYKNIFGDSAFVRLPLVRGVVNFIDSLVLGMSSLNFSAQFFEEEGVKKELTADEAAKAKKKEDAMMGGTVALSIILAVAIFMMLPYWLSTFFAKLGWSDTGIAIAEGVIRVAIFLVYVVGISLMKDIRRVYMYHGAEHKCINCIEHGMDLTVENVKKSSRLHKRCGTSFLFFVVIVSVILFIFIRVESPVLRVVVRILLIPLIAGISYELIRLAGRSEGRIIGVLSKPGMMLQKLTTREPDDDMIEVGIASVEAVFDWKAYVQKMREEDCLDGSSRE
ncbi:MAG: DUF1385 domain-containing protein [bacterium]|nr:DUF1385 domain-containing protein [bacterium]MDY4101089.1 DUF1385 domain-containing protein [Lachnospiraceae bacterium]